MFFLVALTLAQVADPPVALGGALVVHSYSPRPAEGDVALLPDGGLGVVWFDRRRTLGHARTPASGDLWSRGFNLITATAGPTRLVSAGASDDSLGSLRLATNGPLALVAWVEGPDLSAMRSVQLRLWNGQTFQALPAIPDVPPSGGVALTPYASHFAAGWSTVRGAKRGEVTPTGVSLTPSTWDVVPPQPIVDPVIAQLSDGGLLLAGRIGTVASLETAVPLAVPSRPIGLVPNFSRPLATVVGVPSSAAFAHSAVALLTPDLPAPFVGSGAIRMGSDAVIATPGGLSLVAQTGQSYFAQTFMADGRPVLGLAVSGPTGAVLRERMGLVVEPFSRLANGLQVGAVSPITDFPATHRFPSVAWHEDAAAFAIVYEVTTGANGIGAMLWSTDLDFVRPGNHRTVLSITTPSVVLPEPRLVEVAPDRVELEHVGLNSVDNRRLFDTGLTGVRAFVRTPGWATSNGLPRMAFRAQGATTEIMFEGLSPSPLFVSPPRCAAAVNGVHYIAGWNSARTALSITAIASDGGAPIAHLGGVPTASAGVPSSVCLTRSGWGPFIVLGWNEGDTARVSVRDLRSPSLAVAHDFSFAIQDIKDPIAVQLGNGVLIVGESKAGFSELPAVYLGFDGSTVRLGPLATGDSVRNPAVAVRPNGPAFVAWNQFDPNTGATRVLGRMIHPPDGGAADAGSSADGGQRADAGDVPDAGGGPDAGSGFDGGLGADGGVAMDAGIANDAGVAALDGGRDAGGTSPDGGEVLTFVPSCGCSSSGLPALLSVVLVAALRMRRRRH